MSETRTLLAVVQGGHVKWHLESRTKQIGLPFMCFVTHVLERRLPFEQGRVSGECVCACVFPRVHAGEKDLCSYVGAHLCVCVCSSLCACILCRIYSTDQMAVERLRNQYLRGKHTNNASACVCCTPVIKYWLSGFCKNYRLWSKIGYAAYQPVAALWKRWWWLHIRVKCECRQAVWMFVMKYCHQQQMSKCVAGSCCYFCLNEQKSGEGEREKPHSTVLKRFRPYWMLNPEVLSICQTKHSAAFFSILVLLKDWKIKSLLPAS